MDVVADAGESLTDVASRMRFNDVGCVAVIEHGTLVGILTERDLVRAVADGNDFEKLVVADYMTPEPVAVSPETDAREAGRVMVQAGIRHLPVVENDRLLGVMSMRDIVVELIQGGDEF